MQPTKTGWTILPSQWLLLCEGQPATECSTKASGLLRLFPTVYFPRAYFWIAWTSFHQCGCLPGLSISVLIHQSGWSTGSGIPLTWGCIQEWAAAEGWIGTFRLVPPMWVGWHWWPLLWGSCGGSMDKGIYGLGVLSHSSTVPPTRKVVSSMGSVWSLLKSSSTLSLTSFFIWSLGCTPPWVPTEEEGALWYVWGCHFSVPCSGILVAMGAGEITKGAAEPLISSVWSWGTGRGRLAPAWMLQEGTPVSLWLVLTPGMGMPLPWSSSPSQRVFSGTFGCLCPWGLAEGDWAWLQEHLLLYEVGLADLGLLWRPALVICWASSRHSSFMYSFCCQWGSTPGVATYSPW